jgi:hypothetical protein
MIRYIDAFFSSHSKLHSQQLTINDSLRLAPFLTGLRVSSLLLWLTWFWFTNRPLPLRMTNEQSHMTSHLRMNHVYIRPKVKVIVTRMLRPTVSRPVCLCVKHSSGAYDQIFITVRQLRVCWRGGVLSDGRSGLSFTMYEYNVHHVYILHVYTTEVNRFTKCTFLYHPFLSARPLIYSSGIHRKFSCLFADTETFVKSSFTRKRVLYWLGF